jgi:8-oxo-dGTP diphosphatase / 2-hydroxy-dATP diphosphatase
MKKIMTLCLIQRGDEILLGMKKRGFGVGRWNGFGGKLKPDETLEQAAEREVWEEVGMKIEKIDEMGVLDFEFENDPQILEVHIFKAIDFSGEPRESEEMQPRWFKTDEIPYDNMWPDDIFWMPHFLSGKKFKGQFLFDRPSDENYSSRIMEKSISAI